MREIARQLAVILGATLGLFVAEWLR